MASHSRDIIIAPESHEDAGSRMKLDNIEHPGFDAEGNPIIARRSVTVAGPEGHSVMNPVTGVTAVWVPGEIVPQWAADLDTELSE